MIFELLNSNQTVVALSHTKRDTPKPQLLLPSHGHPKHYLSLSSRQRPPLHDVYTAAAEATTLMSSLKFVQVHALEDPWGDADNEVCYNPGSGASWTLESESCPDWRDLPGWGKNNVKVKDFECFCLAEVFDSWLHFSLKENTWNVLEHGSAH